MKNRNQRSPTAIDLIEESCHLLRTVPLATLAVYYGGAVPFVLGLLFFWADMSRNPFAAQHLASGSLGMVLLFIWMKGCQAVFARAIRAQAARSPMALPGVGGWLRILLRQAMVQPSGLFLLPLAVLPVLTLPWVLAFYANLTVMTDDPQAGVREMVRKAWQQARVWPLQNQWLVLTMLAFSACVFLNWLSVGIAVPAAGKILFGIENVFTKSPYAMVNSTFLAAMAGLTYLSIDPILKTAYTLRCFYGDSLRSGEDLKAELRSFAKPAAKLAATALVVLLSFAAVPARAEAEVAPTPTPVGQSVPATDLDRAINRTIQERKYVWRMPREKLADAEANRQPGVIETFFDNIREMVGRWLDAFGDWLHKLFRRDTPPRPTNPSPGGYGGIMVLQILVYGLAVALAGALVFFIVRVWMNRTRGPQPVASEPIATVPDLMDENVHADQLPEDGWRTLARELLERGEFRLAMRAYYLGGLAYLAGCNLISIARFKSNREYERELRRRAHAFPDLLVVFGQNIAAFEQIWYGTHGVDAEVVREFAANVEKLKTGR